MEVGRYGLEVRSQKSAIRLWNRDFETRNSKNTPWRVAVGAEKTQRLK
jgi:hypothetical protein